MTSEAARALWIVDGNNVMGSAGDGWWNDRRGAAIRLVARLATLARRTEHEWLVVFDGAPDPSIADGGGGNLTVEFATRRGRDAADDRIVDLVAERYGGQPDLTVVTSDRGLRRRLPPGVVAVGAGGFLRSLPDPE